MKLSPLWLRDFVDFSVNYHQLADDLTLAGVAVESVSGEGESTVFEMEITTNRPDAMNHYGVARECSALYDVPLKPIEPVLSSASAAKAASGAGSGGTAEAVPFPGPSGAKAQARNESSDAAPKALLHPKPPFQVEIADKPGCARYTARIIRGVTIQASPDAIAKRLLSVDQRPINNTADASNYTLWEMGHPTHAFDLDLLEGGKIVVRRAFSGETLKTLDGVERKLSPEDLVIADVGKPVALAGVMGGFDTMITEKTKNVLIESAWFDPVAVRKSSKRHGLHTDASHRFERGADFGATGLACARVAQRILEAAGGELQGEAIDAVARNLDLAPVSLRFSEIRRILGEALSVDEILRILRRLGFELMPDPGEEPEFTVQIPSWRLDVEREIDLIEEVARLHGYDKFANTLPSYSGSVVDLPEAQKDEKVRATLLALGYNEAISLTFISHENTEQFSAVPVIELANPLSAEAAVMRTSMVPGMLNMLGYNLNRGSADARLFESGNVFERAGSKAVELGRICMGATGSAVEPGVNQAGRPLSFFDLKGDVESLLHVFEHSSVYYDGHTAEYFHPGRSARAVMDGATVAQFGQILPEIAGARKLRQDVFVAEVYLDRLYQHELRRARFEALPRYPAVERDFSFVFGDAVRFEQIAEAITGLGVKELREFVPVEIFRGGAAAEGKYSILLRARFQSGERTLREEEVAGWSAGIVKGLEGLGGVLRG